MICASPLSALSATQVELTVSCLVPRQVAPPGALQVLYGMLVANKLHQPLRYAGVYTDGGVDDRNLLYWVDNLFA